MGGRQDPEITDHTKVRYSAGVLSAGDHISSHMIKYDHMGSHMDNRNGRSLTRPRNQQVVVDSCSLHHGCFILVKRLRQWVLIDEFWAARDVEKHIVKTVGIPEAQMIAANNTININAERRVWGFPASVQV